VARYIEPYPESDRKTPVFIEERTFLVESSGILYLKSLHIIPVEKR
jgi:hypothetical protein